MDISKIKDADLNRLIEARWSSSDTVWSIVKKTVEQNKKVYKNEPDWVSAQVIGRNRAKIRANRIFRDMESVINALIANPPQPNIVPTRDTPESKKLARNQEKYFLKKYTDRNVKEVYRKGLRNLYFSRLVVLKPFWNNDINDFDVKSVDPLKVRFGRTSTREINSEFSIEEVEDTISSVIARFPDKKTEILKEKGFSNEEEAFIQNPTITYKEAWIHDYLICKYGTLILGKVKNPYWDWDGLLMTREEEEQLKTAEGDARKNVFNGARQDQDRRVAVVAQQAEAAKAAQDPAYAEGEAPMPKQPAEMQDTGTSESFNAYYFNHFDQPRKPYIFATILNSEDKPIGDTDFITQAMPLQEGIDRRKQDIDENASLVNGQIKVDSSVMSKASAQQLRYEARGVIWGKGVVNGVVRETGTPLPEFVYQDMVDSRSEIDSIMGATSAFRGEREGQETKAGRLALIDQSYLALNELVQVVDYLSLEMFNWFYQLAKTRYTEHHYAKVLGRDEALETLALMQDDFEDGSEVKVINGKTLPEDRQFKLEQAQVDVEKGILSPVDYLEVAGYNDPAQKAKNRVIYTLNPAHAVGLSPEEMAKIAPPSQPDMPSRSISYKDLPPDGQVQLAEQAGLKLDPKILIAEKLAEQNEKEQARTDEKDRTKAQLDAKNQKPVKSPIKV